MSTAAKAGRKRSAKASRNGRAPSTAKAHVGVVPRGETAAEQPEWRRFVGRWLEAHQCKVEAAPRGDWEVELSAELQKRWRRQRVRPVGRT